MWANTTQQLIVSRSLIVLMMITKIMKITNHVVAYRKRGLSGDSCGPTKAGLLVISCSMNHVGEFPVDGRSCLRAPPQTLVCPKLKLTLSEVPS